MLDIALMSSFCGDDLLKVFSDLHVDLRSLSPNVVRAWFDTDCEANRRVLDWICSSLSINNYISPLEAAEYIELETVADDEMCLKDLAKLGPEFATVFENQANLDELHLLQDEFNILDEKNYTLDQLISVHEDMGANLSLDLTNLTSKEIKSKVDCSNVQKTCVALSERLDRTNSQLREMLIKYDPDAHFVNFVDVEQYQKHVDNLKSGMIPLLELDRLFLDRSDDNQIDSLDRLRKRILQSYRIFLVNKVEIDTLNGILDFLMKADPFDILAGNVSTPISLDGKEMYKKRLCEVLDTVAINFADYHASQIKTRYLHKELDNCRSQSESMSKLLELVVKFVSYYYLTDMLQYDEMEYTCNLQQNLSDYISSHLEQCRYRINHMNLIIDDYNDYCLKSEYEKHKLISAIGKVFSRDCFDLPSTLEFVARLRSASDVLEKEIFYDSFYEEKRKTLRRINDMEGVKSFLKSGPTDKIVLIPMELQQFWLEIGTHLKKESASVAQAVQIPSISRKKISKTQEYLKQLWMHFLTDPSKVETILMQAKADFNEKSTKHFNGCLDASSHRSFM